MKIRVVTVLFANKISVREIPYFRGSIIQLADGDEHFHNHTENGFAYSYPLIQYKCLNGMAAVIGINDAGDILERMFTPSDCFLCQWGKRRVNMKVNSVNTEVCDVEVSESPRVYVMESWLPINQRNYPEYRSLISLRQRIEMLEKILVGNILSFAKGLHLFFNAQVVCEIMRMEKTKTISYKGVELTGFSVTFCTNIVLPDNIGLGKSASVNHGVIKQIR